MIRSEIVLKLDGRLLPGYTPESMIHELREVIGNDIELELIRYEPGPAAPDMGLFDTLAGILRDLDRDGIPVPLLLAAITDARLFSRLGIQTYGFLPMNSHEGPDFMQLIHGPDERIPVDCLDFGARAIYQALQHFEGK